MARSQSSEITVRPQGRLVVPAHLRRQLGISTGDVLVARAEDGRLVLEPREAIVARLRSRFTGVPAGVSLADELIAERREEVRAEDG